MYIVGEDNVWWWDVYSVDYMVVLKGRDVTTAKQVDAELPYYLPVKVTRNNTLL